MIKQALRMWKQAGQDRQQIFKKVLQGFIVVTTLTFLTLTFHRYWNQVATLYLTTQVVGYLALATGLLLASYVWIGWVWAWILRGLGASVSVRWAITLFLITNLAKYLPSNVLHLYGRAVAAIEIGIPARIASLSVIVDSLLLVVAGGAVGLLGATGVIFWVGIVVLPTLFLLLLHPNVIQFLNQRLAQVFKKEESVQREAIALPHYPLWPQVGAMVHVFLRGVSFVITVMAFVPVSLALSLKLIGAFSLGWLLGYVAPGLPAGIGVMEATLITLLQQTQPIGTEGLPMGVLLSAVAVHRLMNTIAETLGAGFAYLFRVSPSQRYRSEG